MTIEQILEKAKQNREKLEEQLQTENEDLVFFNKFLADNNIRSIENLDGLNLRDYLIACIIANGSSIPLKELKDKINSNKLLIETLDEKTFHIVIEFINDIRHFNKRDELKECIDLKDDQLEQNLIISLTAEYHESCRNSILGSLVEEIQNDILECIEKTENIFESLDKKLDEPISKLKCSTEEYMQDSIKALFYIKLLTNKKDKPLKILELLEEDAAIIKKSLDCISEIKALQARKPLYCDAVDFWVYRKKRKINNNYKKKKMDAVYAIFKKDMPKSINAFENMNDKLCEYYAQQLESDKKIKAEQLVYDDFIKKIPGLFEKEEITEYENLVSKIPDSELRLETLKQIYLHNQKYYESLEAKHKELSENSVISYQLLLQQYGVPKDTYDPEHIKKNSVEDTKYILSELQKMEIKDPESIIEILATTTKKTVEKITSFKEKGVLQSSFISQHKNLFDEHSEAHKDLLSNLDYLNKSKISPRYFEQSQDVLLINSEQFSNNVKMLEDYKLINSMKKNIKYDFLYSDKLAEAIDDILELGYESNLETNLNLLNYNENRWQRIKVLHQLNGPIDSTEEIEGILAAKNFFIPDNKLSDYIYNAVPDNLLSKISELSSTNSTETQIDLNDYNYTDRTYKIGSAIISKNKVARNFKKLEEIVMEPEERVLVSVVTGSTLNDEEYRTVRKTLDSSVKS